jgi:hypothetical protein
MIGVLLTFMSRVASGKASSDGSSYKGELRQLGQDSQDLHRKLSGTLSFEPTEPNITLKMTGDGRGT